MESINIPINKIETGGKEKKIKYLFVLKKKACHIKKFRPALLSSSPELTVVVKSVAKEMFQFFY